VNTWKVILATILIFGSGVVTGGLLVRRSDHFETPRQGRLPVAASLQLAAPGGYRLEFLRHAQRELNLTGEQRERVEKIFKQSQERTKQLMEPVTPHLREELERAKLEFREVLTPAQQARFEELLKQRVRDQRREKGTRAHDKEAPVEPPTRSPRN
jgi:Spy/CpxP family protein refolding chaperone